MRLVHLADLHLGYRQFQRLTSAGINQREADVAAVFRSAIDKIIELKPDLICVAGDIFHNVRPPNPAILEAFSQFSRLVQTLPDAIVVFVAGNHDTPRATDSVCILRLFSQLSANVVVVDTVPRSIPFPDHDLSVLAVPWSPGRAPALNPEPAFRYNVLVYHGEMVGVTPAWDPERTALQITPEDVHAERWSYAALGHHHVFHQIAPNACYSGAIDYTSLNIWGEPPEERAAGIRGGGKVLVEYDLDARKLTRHAIKPARALVDLPPIKANAMTAADVDAAVRHNVERSPGGIADKIVRQLVRDIPRHIARELDYKALREFQRRALHFQLDTRRPEIPREISAGAPGRRPTLTEIVRDKLRSRVLPPDIDRDTLVALGLHYLGEADSAENAALAATAENA